MPQMSPLMWGNLFVAFSFLLFLASVKTDFSFSKPMPSSTTLKNNLTSQSFNWTW